MVRLSWAASGEEVSDVRHLEGETVQVLKESLALLGSRFQLRIFDGGTELADDQVLLPEMQLQLMVLQHLPADEERDETFATACRLGLLPEVQKGLYELQDPNVAQSLCDAARMGRYEVVRLLLEAKAVQSCGDFGRTPLHYAAEEGHFQVAELLLSAGGQLDAKDDGGLTALHRAAWFGQCEVLACLLRARADPEERDGSGSNALHCAAAFDQVRAIALLLDARADLEATTLQGRGTDEGITALHLTGEHGNAAAARLLMERGANPDAQCSLGMNPFQRAVEKRHWVTIEVLNGAEKDVVGWDGHGSKRLSMRFLLETAGNH